MKGKLCDNLTTHCFNTEQFHDCIIYAKQAIEIKPDSLECYIKWAEALYKIKQTEDGHSVLLKALENCQQKEDKVKICIHIFDLNSRSDQCDTIHLTIEVDLFEEVVNKLLSDDDSKSWKILDNIANYSPMFEDLNKSIEIPLERVLSMDSKSFELKEEFVLKLCKRLHWKKLESSIPTLTKKGFLDTIAQIFIKRGKDRNVLEAPILTATRFVIKTGKLMLLNKVIEQLGQNELLGTAKTAVQECCAGGFTDKKLDALNILFIQTQGLENLKFSHDLRKHLSKNDGRYALFIQFKHGVIDEGDQQNVQSKPDDGENTGPDVIRLDSHLNVDKELGEFISALDVHLRKMSQEQRKRSLARASSLEEAKMRKRIMEEVAIVDRHEVEIVESEMVSVEEDLEDKTFQEEDFEEEDNDDEDNDDDEEFDLEKISLGDTWEVECTQEVYRVLRNKKVPLKMKKKSSKRSDNLPLVIGQENFTRG
ncbi:uncharacterized protein [Clytia hemisphaerica]|uniref:uncharacterized protein n=1 Tax=Clytia hemisphaerica TaxID=252671 RepID=UPI0034D64D26